MPPDAAPEWRGTRHAGPKAGREEGRAHAPPREGRRGRVQGPGRGGRRPLPCADLEREYDAWVPQMIVDIEDDI